MPSNVITVGNLGFTLVVINQGGDAYYQVESVELGKLHQPLDKQGEQMVKAKQVAAHVPYPPGDSIEKDLAPAPAASATPFFCGTFYLNLNAVSLK